MPGLTLKTNQEINKGDIVVLCKCLNEEFKGSCEFEPEGISEGGILYKFRDGTPGYKSVRLDRNAGKWGWINEDVMSEWLENTDIIFASKTKFYIYLKHLDGAPPFTIDELQIWEKCFNQIGVEKVGKYPSKRELNN